MGQNFIIFFSWVDIHSIYYKVGNINQIWWFVYFIKQIFSKKNDVEFNLNN